jgi:hypothetical protein
VAAALGRRIGSERGLVFAMLAMALGSAVRIWTAPLLFAGTIVASRQKRRRGYPLDTRRSSQICHQPCREVVLTLKTPFVDTSSTGEIELTLARGVFAVRDFCGSESCITLHCAGLLATGAPISY